MKSSLQLKILIYYSLILFSGFSVLTFVVYNTTRQNSQWIIREDMIAAKRNLDVYLSQYLLFGNQDLTAASLPAEAPGISRQLSSQVGCSVELYSLQGKKLSYGSVPADGLAESKDLSQALKG
ncbi:hypothetical protein, partial [Desulfosporosinus sp. OT]|uniref:hypothetical protein n=1 Tax=Desulfosporosinus sp. OT TaxID=913865 RepID=UPI00192BFB62